MHPTKKTGIILSQSRDKIKMLSLQLDEVSTRKSKTRATSIPKQDPNTEKAKKKNSVCYGKTQHVVYGMTQHVVYVMTQHVVYGMTQHVVYGMTQHVVYGMTQHVVYGMTQHVVYGMIQHFVYGKIQHVLFSRVLCSLLCVWMKSSKTRCREHMF